jgi:hypothetical protein
VFQIVSDPEQGGIAEAALRHGAQYFVCEGMTQFKATPIAGNLLQAQAHANTALAVDVVVPAVVVAGARIHAKDTTPEAGDFVISRDGPDHFDELGLADHKAQQAERSVTAGHLLTGNVAVVFVQACRPDCAPELPDQDVTELFAEQRRQNQHAGAGILLAACLDFMGGGLQPGQ